MTSKTRLHGGTARQLRSGKNHFQTGLNERKRGKWLAMNDALKCEHEWESVSAIVILCAKCGTIKVG